MDSDNVLIFVSFLIFLFSLLFLVQGYLAIDEFLTGNIISEGEVRINISRVILYNFTLDSINWGAGYVLATGDSATLDTLGNVWNGTWEAVSEGFEVANMGNVNLSLNLSSGLDAEEFIGGTEPRYQYNVTNVDSGACVPGTDFSLGDFYNVSVNPDSHQICSNFESGKHIRIDLRLVIPINSNQGNLTDSFSLVVQEA